MPPKAAAAGSSKKAVEKDKKKKIEDKTFGLKNKNKSSKVAAYVKNVESQVANSNSAAQKKLQAKLDANKKEKELQEKAKKELDALLKPVVQQAKVPMGVDPKSIVCEFFKVNQCSKGLKCKFAHDLAVARKSGKIDIYTDRRGDEDKKDDNMENWDDDKLKTVVDKKKRSTEKGQNKTDKICKYFLDAIETKKYGWFWDCPNGEKCQYQHCLPEGYVLKKKKITNEEEEEPIPIEELIEEERAKLTKHTPVTLETFLKWKEEKRINKEKVQKEAEEKRLADIKAGKTSMSGREMFVFNPDLFVDDDSAIDVKSKEYEFKEEMSTITNNIDKSLFIGDDLDDLPSDEEDDDENDEEEDDDEDDDEAEDEDEPKREEVDEEEDEESDE